MAATLTVRCRELDQASYAGREPETQRGVNAPIQTLEGGRIAPRRQGRRSTKRTRQAAGREYRRRDAKSDRANRLRKRRNPGDEDGRERECRRHRHTRSERRNIGGSDDRVGKFLSITERKRRTESPHDVQTGEGEQRRGGKALLRTFSSGRHHIPLRSTFKWPATNSIGAIQNMKRHLPEAHVD